MPSCIVKVTKKCEQKTESPVCGVTDGAQFMWMPTCLRTELAAEAGACPTRNESNTSRMAWRKWCEAPPPYDCFNLFLLLFLLLLFFPSFFWGVGGGGGGWGGGGGGGGSYPLQLTDISLLQLSS